MILACEDFDCLGVFDVIEIYTIDVCNLVSDLHSLTLCLSPWVKARIYWQKNLEILIKVLLFYEIELYLVVLKS